MNKLEKINELTTELKKYCETEGSEVGEVCEGLICISGYMDYVSDEFHTPLIKELEYQINNFKLESRGE